MSDYNVEVIQATDIEAVKIATGKCYNRTIGDKALLHIIEAGHLSVMEHSIATLDLTCSQKVLAQITRHRHFSFTVQSSRGMDRVPMGISIKKLIHSLGSLLITRLKPLLPTTMKRLRWVFPMNKLPICYH